MYSSFLLNLKPSPMCIKLAKWDYIGSLGFSLHVLKLNKVLGLTIVLLFAFMVKLDLCILVFSIFERLLGSRK